MDTGGVETASQPLGAATVSTRGRRTALRRYEVLGSARCDNRPRRVRFSHAIIDVKEPEAEEEGVLEPFAVDQAADLCSCGHENDDSAAGLVCMSWTAPGTRTTATWNA